MMGPLTVDACSLTTLAAAITLAGTAGVAQWRSNYFAVRASVPDEILTGTPEFTLFGNQHWQEVFERERCRAWQSGYANTAILLGVAAAISGSASVIHIACWFLLGLSSTVAIIALWPVFRAASQMTPLYRQQWGDTFYDKYTQTVTKEWPGLANARAQLVQARQDQPGAN